jgi:hypothetical protein
MAIVVGDILGFLDISFWATVIGGDAAGGWLCMIGNGLGSFTIDDASALAAQATFVADPAGAPPTGSVVTFSETGFNASYIVDGYFLSPGIAETVALVIRATDPAQNAYAFVRSGKLQWNP